SSIAGKLLKHLISTVAEGGLVVALAVGGLAANAASLSGDAPPPRPNLATIAPAPAPAPLVETDLQRRERLSRRPQGIVRSGGGARLTDPRPTSRRAAVARPAQPAARVRTAESRPAQGRAPRAPARAETSTIAPPPTRTTAANYSGGRYRPPVL